MSESPAPQAPAPDMTEWYDERLYHAVHREFAEGCDFANYGFWEDDVHSYRQACENLVLRLLDFIPEKTGTILDVGCGKGETTLCLTRFYPADRITAINVSTRQLDTARTKVPGAAFHFMDAAAMAFPDAAFDAVISVEAAFHFHTRERFLCEAMRVLKPGGRLVLSDMLMLREAEERRPFHHVENFLETPAAYRAMLEAIGFVDCRVDDETERTWGRAFLHIIRFLHERYLRKEISLAFMQDVLRTNYTIAEDILAYLLVAVRKP